MIGKTITYRAAVVSIAVYERIDRKFRYRACEGRAGE
jgi:hypothetical protein